MFGFMNCSKEQCSFRRMTNIFVIRRKEHCSFEQFMNPNIRQRKICILPPFANPRLVNRQQHWLFLKPRCKPRWWCGIEGRRTDNISVFRITKYCWQRGEGEQVPVVETRYSDNLYAAYFFFSLCSW